MRGRQVKQLRCCLPCGQEYALCGARIAVRKVCSGSCAVPKFCRDLSLNSVAMGACRSSWWVLLFGTGAWLLLEMAGAVGASTHLEVCSAFENAVEYGLGEIAIMKDLA